MVVGNPFLSGGSGVGERVRGVEGGESLEMGEETRSSEEGRWNVEWLEMDAERGFRG